MFNHCFLSICYLLGIPLNTGFIRVNLVDMIPAHEFSMRSNGNEDVYIVLEGQRRNTSPDWEGQGKIAKRNYVKS